MATSILLGVGSILGLAALYVTDPVLIYKSHVPMLIQQEGYNSELISKMLRERIRAIALEAGTRRGNALSVFNANESTFDTLAEQLHIDSVVDALREFLSLHKYSIQPYIVNSNESLKFTVSDIAADQRLIQSASRFKFSLKGETADNKLFYVSTNGGNTVQTLINDLAVAFIERVDPYALSLYYFRREYAAGEFTQTLPMVRHSIRVLPYEAKVYPILLLGEIYARQGQYDRAIVKYRQGLALAPGSTEAMALIGKALIAQGETEGGLVMLREAVEHAAADLNQLNEIYWPTVHVHLGDFLAGFSCQDPAHYYCIQVTANDPTADPIRDSQARDVYVQGLELVPDNPYLKTGLGALYLRHGQLDAAITLLQEAILDHPQAELACQLLDQALIARNAADGLTSGYDPGSRAYPLPRRSQPKPLAQSQESVP